MVNIYLVDDVDYDFEIGGRVSATSYLTLASCAADAFVASDKAWDSGYFYHGSLSDGKGCSAVEFYGNDANVKLLASVAKEELKDIRTTCPELFI